MAQRRVVLRVDGELAWLLAVPDLLPCHTRPATPEALGELAARYLPKAVDDELTCRAAGVVARLIAAHAPRGPRGE